MRSGYFTSYCLIIAIALSFATAFYSPVNAQSALDDERDGWEGSSLGVRLEMQDGYPTIDTVYEHVRESSPFIDGDRIEKIAELEFPAETLGPLRDLMKTTQPDARLHCVVLRDGEAKSLTLTTYRLEFVDIQAIYRRLYRNKIIKDHLQATQRGQWFDDFTARMSNKVGSSASPRLATEAINSIIDEIGVSHTAIIPSSAGLGFGAETVGGIGILLQRHQIGHRSGYFVVDMKPGGPADQSKLLIGDEVLRVNGLAISDSKRLDLSGHEARYQLYNLMVKDGETVNLEVLSSPFEDTHDVEVIGAAELSTLQAFRNSARAIESSGLKFGYVRFWNLMSMRVATDFKSKIEDEFSEADCIIMDLRGRGGIVPAVTSLDRTVGEMELPVVAIIDGLTRSAKEMLAYLIKKHDNVTVIGTKTSGAVTGATFLRLPSGNSLMFPVASADSLGRYLDGEIIEGVGVEPDEEFKFFVPYAAGTDHLLNAAIKKAAQLAKNRTGINRR